LIDRSPVARWKRWSAKWGVRVREWGK
jgi:hypothetical protein